MISDDVKLDYKDVLIVPDKSPVSSRKDVELTTRVPFAGRNVSAYEGVPIMAANMDGVGTLEMADGLRRHRIFTCLTKFYSADALASFFRDAPERSAFTAVTVGISESEWEKFRTLFARNGVKVDYICLDVANGYTDRFVACIDRYRREYPGLVIIAGNVVTHDQTIRLIEAGADVVKVGIGGGSVCETRIKTGVGYPQFSAILECAHAAHRVGKSIVADGGCTVPGDVAKALAAGADFAMLGGMFAGHCEGGGRKVTRYFRTDEVDADNNPIPKTVDYVEFYGMSSKTANDKHFGGLQDYRSSEGRTVFLPHKPSLSDTLVDLLGGLRSTCSYVGARRIGELSEKSSFVRCNQTHNRIFQDMV